LAAKELEAVTVVVAVLVAPLFIFNQAIPAKKEEVAKRSEKQ